MKTNPLVLVLIGSALASSAHGQLLAHWDYPGFHPDTANHPDCLKFENSATGVKYSTQSSGSEGTKDYTQFAGWGNKLDTSEFVSFTTTFSNATGTIDTFNFDARTYANGFSGTKHHPTEFYVQWFLDGVSQGSFDSGTDPFDPTLTTSFQDFSINLNGLDASLGSVAEIRFTAYDRNGFSSGTGRIGLDNIRLFGSAECIPEPSTNFLVLLSGLGLISRRRR